MIEGQVTRLSFFFIFMSNIIGYNINNVVPLLM